MFKRLVVTLSASVLLAATASAQQIMNPDVAYLAATTKFTLPPDDGSTFTTLTEGSQVLTFSTAVERRTFPDTWGTWSSTPFSEYASGAAIPLAFCNGCASLGMTLSSAVNIFGFEAEPEPFAVHGFTARFFNNGDLLGTITRDVDGVAGARLFAFESAIGINRIEFTSDDSDSQQTIDFAMAAFRFGGASSVPEPATFALLGLGLVGLAGAARRRRV